MEHSPATGPGREIDGGHALLLEEMRAKVQSILHHLTITILLFMRLLMLPVVFWYHILKNMINSAGPSTWPGIKRWISTLMDLVPGHIKKHWVVIECVRRLHSLHHSAKKLFRIARLLYSLGLLLDDNPDLLKLRCSSNPPQANRTQTGASASSPENRLTYHATASQVYHAALAKDHTTLDDLLAGFTDDAESTQADQNLDIDCQRCQRRARYRNSSIQTTPERMLTPQKTRLNESEASREVDGGLCLGDERTVNRRPSAKQNSLMLTLSPAFPSALDVTSATHPSPRPRDDEKQSIDSHIPACGPEGCQREIARQAQSRLPRRRSSPPDLGTEPEVEIPTHERQSVASTELVTHTRRANCSDVRRHQECNNCRNFSSRLYP